MKKDTKAEINPSSLHCSKPLVTCCLKSKGLCGHKKENKMTEQEILKGNKLIAEFMGIKIVKRNDEDAVFLFENAAFPEYFRCTKFNTYNSSWDWLMPVVEKIDRYEDIEVKMIGSKCAIKLPNKKTIQCHTIVRINSTWRIVIKFIEWYNSQPVSTK